MNIRHVHAVSLAGLQYWFSDRKSIIMRFFLWPNLMPIVFMLLVGLGLSVMMLRSAPSAGISAPSGSSFTIFGDKGYDVAISQVMTDNKTRFTYIPLKEASPESATKAIQEQRVTFALKVNSLADGKVEINIVYDRERDYIHKNWIDKIKDRGPDIALAIRKARFSEYRVTIDEAVIAHTLAPINLKVTPYGKSNGSMTAAVMVFFLWGVLLVAPLDAAASITSSQMLSDTSEDFISIWKSAGVEPGDMVIGRFIPAILVFVLALLTFFLSLAFWTSLYLYMVDILVSAMNKSQLNNEDLYLITVGFRDLVQSISVSNILTLLIMLISTGCLIIMVRLRLSVYSCDLEQVRTKLKPVEVVLYNLPIIGFLAGTFTPSVLIFSFPVMNQLIMMQFFFKGGVPHEFLAIGLVANFLLMTLVYVNTRRHISSQQRLIINGT